MGLRLEKIMEQHEVVKPRKTAPGSQPPMVLFYYLYPLGSALDFGDYWDWEKLSSFEARGITKPSPQVSLPLSSRNSPMRAG